MREREAVQPAPDLFDEFARLVELEQPRVVAAGVDEDVTLELVATPTTSPKYTPGGSFRKFGTDSYAISGTF